MQRTLVELFAYVNRWDMDFNVKCSVMHIRKTNLNVQHQVNDGWVKSVEESGVGVNV